MQATGDGSHPEQPTVRLPSNPFQRILGQHIRCPAPGQPGVQSARPDAARARATPAHRCAAVAWPALLAALSLAVYLYTLAPALTWADGARLQTELALRGSLYLSLDETAALPGDGLAFDRLGVAGWDHPLYIELGQLFLGLPLGDRPWRSNLMSAVAGSAGVVLLYYLARRLTGSRPAAGLAGLALALSHTYWFHAVTTENSTLHAVFLLALTGFALRWQARRRAADLLALGLVAGLGLANHVMLVLALVPVAGLIAAEWIVPAAFGAAAGEIRYQVHRGAQRAWRCRRAARRGSRLVRLERAWSSNPTRQSRAPTPTFSRVAARHRRGRPHNGQVANRAGEADRPRTWGGATPSPRDTTHGFSHVGARHRRGRPHNGQVANRAGEADRPRTWGGATPSPRDTKAFSWNGYPEPAGHPSPAMLAAAAGLFVLGWAPWWIQFLRMARLTGLSALLLLVFKLSGSNALWAGLAPATIAANLLQYAGWLAYQFTPVGVAAGIYGMVWLWRRRRGAAGFLIALYVLHAFWSANYQIPDRFAAHLSSYVLFALFLSCGAAGLLNPLRRASFGQIAAAPRPGANTRWLAAGVLTVWLAGLAGLPVLYARAPALLRSLGWDEARLGIRPIGDGGRDALAYFLTPGKRGEDSAGAFGRGVMAGLAPGAIVYAARPGDEETFIVLYYHQAVEGRRPDVTLRFMLSELPAALPGAVLAEARSQAGCRPLYLASLDPALYPLAALGADFTITPEAHLYRLIPRQARPQSSPCPALVTHPPGLTLAQLIRSGIK